MRYRKDSITAAASTATTRGRRGNARENHRASDQAVLLMRMLSRCTCSDFMSA